MLISLETTFWVNFMFESHATSGCAPWLCTKVSFRAIDNARGAFPWETWHKKGGKWNESWPSDDDLSHWCLVTAPQNKSAALYHKQKQSKWFFKRAKFWHPYHHSTLNHARVMFVFTKFNFTCSVKHWKTKSFEGIVSHSLSAEREREGERATPRGRGNIYITLLFFSLTSQKKKVIIVYFCLSLAPRQRDSINTEGKRQMYSPTPSRSLVFLHVALMFVIAPHWDFRPNGRVSSPHYQQGVRESWTRFTINIISAFNARRLPHKACIINTTAERETGCTCALYTAKTHPHKHNLHFKTYRLRPVWMMMRGLR